MYIDDFDWDGANRDHISRHGVQDYEVEEVVLFDRPFYLKGPDGKYYAYGVAESGRYLFIVFVLRSGAMIRVITARDMMKKEKAYYKKRR